MLPISIPTFFFSPFPSLHRLGSGPEWAARVGKAGRSPPPPPTGHSTRLRRACPLRCASPRAGHWLAGCPSGRVTIGHRKGPLSALPPLHSRYLLAKRASPASLSLSLTHTRRARAPGFLPCVSVGLGCGQRRAGECVLCVSDLRGWEPNVSEHRSPTQPSLHLTSHHTSSGAPTHSPAPPPPHLIPFPLLDCVLLIPG